MPVHYAFECLRENRPVLLTGYWSSWQGCLVCSPAVFPILAQSPDCQLPTMRRHGGASRARKRRQRHLNIGRLERSTGHRRHHCGKPRLAAAVWLDEVGLEDRESSPPPDWASPPSNFACRIKICHCAAITASQKLSTFSSIKTCHINCMKRKSNPLLPPYAGNARSNFEMPLASVED